MSSSDTRERKMSTSNYCHICCHDSDLFCVGPCDHPICFECGVRMRVICESNECPICRADIKTMLVVKGDRLSPYSTYESGRRLLKDEDFDKKYGFRFENAEALNAVKDILAHVCTVCEKEPEFSNFEDLAQHLRRIHGLYYCDLCVENLQLFSWERKCYSREQLAKHRRIGDPDDRSHRGHPLCEFCDERYMEEEQLYRHLRRDHFFCHFCDADGMNKFYPSSEELKKHMKLGHFLCEEGQCKQEPLGIAFRHDIDFKAHKATVHRDKQQRLVNLDFGGRRDERPKRERDGANVERGAPRGRGAGGQGARGGSGRNDQRRRGPQGRELPDAVSEVITDAPAETSTFALRKEEFPSLNPSAKQALSSSAMGKIPESMATRLASSSGLSVRSGSLDEHDFPALSTRSGGKGKAKKNANGRIRRSSRSISPGKNINENRTFVMVDDDELFPSFSEQSKMSISSMEKNAVEKEKEQPRQQQNKSKSGWGPTRPALSSKSTSKSSAWATLDEAFPTLPSSARTGTKHKDNKKKSDLMKTPWSQLILVDGGNEQISSKKGKEQKEVEKMKKEKSPSSMPTENLLEALPPGLPVKSKARRVAQQKQRPSESNEDQMDEVEGMMKKMPPPGFEHAAGTSVPPPPGFDPPNVQNGLAKYKVENGPYNSGYTYTKPTDFDIRNRALFDRLCSLMNKEESKIQAFKEASSEYRRAETDAPDYSQRVRHLLDDVSGNVDVICELICLLPDIERQNELWDAFVSDIATGRLVRDAIKRCGKCGQLLVKMDYYEHAQSAHPMKGMGIGKGRNELEEDFPPLS